MVITHRARVRRSWCSACEQSTTVIISPAHSACNQVFFVWLFDKVFFYTVLNAKLSLSVLSNSFYLPRSVEGIISQHWAKLLFKSGHHPLNNPCSTSLPTLSNQDREAYKETVLLLVNMQTTGSSCFLKCLLMTAARSCGDVEEGGEHWLQNRRWQRSQQL